MLIVDRLNRATDHDHAVCGDSGHRACGFNDRCRLRSHLRKGAQAEDTSHCEQKHVLQDSSYWQVSAVLRWTFVTMTGTICQS